MKKNILVARRNKTEDKIILIRSRSAASTHKRGNGGGVEPPLFVALPFVTGRHDIYISFRILYLHFYIVLSSAIELSSFLCI